MFKPIKTVPSTMSQISEDPHDPLPPGKTRQLVVRGGAGCATAPSPPLEALSPTSEALVTAAAAAAVASMAASDAAARAQAVVAGAQIAAAEAQVAASAALTASQVAANSLLVRMQRRRALPPDVPGILDAYPDDVPVQESLTGLVLTVGAVEDSDDEVCDNCGISGHAAHECDRDHSDAHYGHCEYGNREEYDGYGLGY